MTGLPDIMHIDTEKYGLAEPNWTDICTEANYTRAIRMRVNETHWTLETGHVLYERENNRSIDGNSRKRSHISDNLVLLICSD